ncbi:sugar phosphate isomerase/epimerase [Candidatus Woesearchaeota archaeon]|nr:sugar phosphate isomerase/epimerase [Candidatus Woesearchaeota archaeon]MBW3005589.1 sugar phosphate isomerase/epimerase [Candidatus Woesearchaeota archaeon]
MAEWRTQPYNPMDRQYHETIEIEPARSHANIEEPIIPISELGQTIPERDPAGRFKNIIQTAQAAIRRGAGKMQLMLMTPPESAVGGRPKAYGKEVREVLKDVFKANEAMLSGVEMPSAMNNLSGYDPQRGTFDDEKMKRDMDEVKDAIKFAADVGQGGGVDIVSWEYARPLFNADWNQDKKGQPIFEDTGEPIVQVVDERTGRIQGMRINEIEKVPVALDKETGEPYKYNPDIGQFVDYKGEPAEIKPWKWEDYQKWAKVKGTSPEQLFMEEQLNTQIYQARGWAATYREHVEHTREKLEIAKAKLAKAKTEDERQSAQAKIDDLNIKYDQEVDTIKSYEQQAAENEKKKDALTPLGKYAMERTTDSYAKLGIAARQETIYNKNAKRPVSVGPELGWPHAFGSHPKEFKELIHTARDRMVHLLTNKQIEDPKTGGMRDNPYYEPGMSRSAAEEAAVTHIKGCLDTSHLGMWFQHFKPELPWHERVEKFNKWYMEEVKELAKGDEVGSIQLVNSMSGAHGHLPPGQGIFPVVEAAKEFKKQGFKGFMVSEGHEEEAFNEGRILVETWRAFNAPFESQYGPGAPARGWGDIEGRYLGDKQSPRQMFGSYVPPFGEYKPWTEIPLE